MNAEETMNVFKSLAMSQGCYGRLVRALEDAEDEQRDCFLAQFEDCETSVEVVMRLECDL